MPEPSHAKQIFKRMYFISGFDYGFLGIAAFFMVASFVVGAINKKKKPKALDILGERYAKGEITKEDFDQKKKDLES